jgi:hypothetical protein
MIKKHHLKFNLLFAALFMCSAAAMAQAPIPPQPDSIQYNHLDVFGPIVWPTTSGETRSASGQPGSHYWQNRADYQIKATLTEGEQDTTITGDVNITYTNNSPDLNPTPAVRRLPQ